MSTTRYLVLTTLWATTLPGLVVSLPFLLLACLTPGFAIAVPLLILCGFLFYRFGGFIKNLHVAAREGSIPTFFPVRILPFFLPLFYVQILSAVGLCLAPTSRHVVETVMTWGLPQYLPWSIFNALIVVFGGAGTLENAVLVPLVASGVTALAGTIHVACLKPRPKFRLSAVALMLLITFGLGAASLRLYENFRGDLLAGDRNAVVIQDEKGRERWGGDETDLTEYRPFQPDNKLVKLDSPTLAIDTNHPRIHGALALYPVYAAAVEAIYRDVDPKLFNNAHEAGNMVQGGTTPAAFAALLEDKVDMIFMAMPSPEQLEQAERHGKTISITPIGIEAFVFFVSKTNPVDNLSVEQIRDIYSKQITRWSEVGGRNERILPFQRPEGSGSQTAMERIMGDVPLAKPVQEEFQISMGGIVNRVADYRNYGNSIGYSFRYYVEGMFKHDGVKLLSVDGIEPTVENIRNGVYPFTGPMVVITAGSQNPNVPKLIDWFLSPQGRDLLERVGYVPLYATEEAREE